ncbi:PBECR2 nuclease fold domain-containing protein [Halodesulfovibrio aestuarii]|uniref:Phage putative head morphogenesis protein, SPP1 gp7 family n=1 Tax=Halodesulfovibrio aestuarii TaxID=126333 RepID=A0A8G2C7B2_9BACT|nr:PBECR2 nuclease fold domain-containing protein [Halodesulfovibrio aestuarii]SHI60651.1 phage putative head morphogenesis protein, SPP1 gp7 family [Halodesulfovibrio aestuarii]
MIKPVALPPEVAIAYWKDKVPVSASEYKALNESARSRAFAVSSLARVDQVAAMQDAIGRAIKDGETFEDFKKRIVEIAKNAELRPWQLANIYRTNIQSAYMAGRYTQMKRTTKSRPYWRYVAVGDQQTRLDHLALHGKVYPHDHEFWDSFFPPNGFGCRCSVQSLSDFQMRKRGLKAEKDMPGIVHAKHPATGEPLPPVRPKPDAGFAANVGKNWHSGLTPSELPDETQLVSKTHGAVCRASIAFAGHQKGAGCTPPLAELEERHILPVTAADLLPEGLSSEQYVKAFLSEFGLPSVKASTLHTLPSGHPVVISKSLFIDKKTGLWKVKKSGREQHLRLLARTIKNPFEVWQVPSELTGKPVHVLRTLRVFTGENGRIGGFGVFNLVNGRKWVGATTFTPKLGNEKGMLKYLEKQRQGVLLYREP